MVRDARTAEVAGGRRRIAGRTGVALFLLVAVTSLIAALVVRGSDVTSPVASAALRPPAGAALTASERVLLPGGVTFGPGWRPEGILGEHDPWRDWDPERGAAAWTTHITPRRLLEIPSEPFVETAVIEPRPAPCYHFHRAVTAADVGLGDPVGHAIEQDILAWLEPAYFSGEVASARDPRCAGRDRAEWGFALEEVHRVPCTLPGRDVRCFTVGQWAYHLGEADMRWSAHLVYDAVTGERLDGTDMVPWIGRDALRVIVDDLVCAAGGTCDGVTLRDGQARPTTAALVLEFSPGEADLATAGTRRLTVPWTLLRGSPLLG